MKIFRNTSEIDMPTATAVTVGTFDGVHRGHQKVLNSLKKIAAANGLSSVVVTFHPHPQTVVGPRHGQKIEFLSTLEEKLERLAELGIDAVLIIPFTHKFSQMSYQDFTCDILVKRLKSKVIVIGHDHAFGKDREGHEKNLQRDTGRFGFEVVPVPAYVHNGHTISSTAIRKLLNAGNVAAARESLGHPYRLSGTVVKGDQRGRKLGFPTANVLVPTPNKLIPKVGVYAVNIQIGRQQYRGMMNVGHRPTFNFDPLTLEAHIFKFSGLIYGEKIIIEFLAFIRDEIKFKDHEALIKQLEEDKKNCLNI